MNQNKATIKEALLIAIPFVAFLGFILINLIMQDKVWEYWTWQATLALTPLLGVAFYAFMMITEGKLNN